MDQIYRSQCIPCYRVFFCDFTGYDLVVMRCVPTRFASRNHKVASRNYKITSFRSEMTSHNHKLCIS